jgi:hypothetical protein
MFHISKIQTTSNETTARLLHSAVIAGSEQLSDEFTLVNFKSDCSNHPLLPGQELLLYSDNGGKRSYTCCSVDKVQRQAAVLLYGDVNNCAVNTTTGNTLQFSIEKEKMVYDALATHHFFFGDETSIGLFNAYKEIALQNNHEYFGVLELKPHNEQVLNKLKLLVDSVPPADAKPSQHAIQWMEEMHPNCWMAWKKASFYLAGKPRLIQPFGEYLLRRGVSPLQIQMTVLGL